eukprot:scaffold8131_cov74-Cylindrotheca_fusiformis.AAC.3
MTSPPAKEWTIFYHYGGSVFKGRAEFLRLMLEDKQVDYDITGDNLRGSTGDDGLLSRLCRGHSRRKRGWVVAMVEVVAEVVMPI